MNYKLLVIPLSSSERNLNFLRVFRALHQIGWLHAQVAGNLFPQF